MNGSGSAKTFERLKKYTECFCKTLKDSMITFGSKVTVNIYFLK